MSSILLPLEFPSLSHIRYSEAIREAVRLCIDQDTNLTISVTCDEIKQQSHIDIIWYKIQLFLSALYVVQLTEAYQQNKPLFQCDILFQDVCGYPIYLEPSIHAVCLVPGNTQTVNIQEWQQARNTPLKEYHLKNQSIAETTLKAVEDQRDHPTFQRVAVGGTFDHIHAGHKILLTMTALLATSSMVVGVTDDIMLVKKKHRELIVPIDKRIQQVKDYLFNVKRGLIYDVVPITDPYGPTITDPTIDALVVSKETLKGGHMVNDERKLRDYPLLAIRVIDVISSNNAAVEVEDMDALKISSSWIRSYLANRVK